MTTDEQQQTKKQPPVIPPKKPKLTKAERRALQEKQRAAKAAKQAPGGGGGGGGKQQNQSKKSGKKTAAAASATESETTTTKPKNTDADEAGGGVDEEKKDDKTVELFSHLPQYRDRSHDPHLSGVTLSTPTTSTPKNSPPLHPAVLHLGLQYANGSIRGANARCRAMMSVFKTLLRSYPGPLSPTESDVRHDLDAHYVKPSFQHYTTLCRPHSVTMGNAVTFLKTAIQNLDRDVEVEEAKETLLDLIDAYVTERITFAGEIIAKFALTKIAPGDVILIYGHVEVMEVILGEVPQKDSVRVIVADSRPLWEGKKMLSKLVKKGLNCSYILLNSLSYVMKDVTKVFLGAAALMSDGSILSRVGTASVALMAKASNIPVLVACETYKISHRVQLESITGNELGDPDEVARTTDGEEGCLLEGWREKKRGLKLLNLMYDLTPSKFVSGVITELGILPPTSVTVLLREMKG